MVWNQPYIHEWDNKYWRIVRRENYMKMQWYNFIIVRIKVFEEQIAALFHSSHHVLKV